MERTATPARIVQQLRKERVAQWHALAQQLDCSTKTVQRALAQVGYYNSLNYNATFVTLQDVPRFDPHGLWTYQDVHFSQHGNLPQTIRQLIERAPAGYTVEELEGLVGTRVHNHVSRLLQEGTLARCFQGRSVVYLAADPRRRESQETVRRQAEPPIPFSSLYDVQAKFLFYFGHLHRQRAAAVAERLRNRGGGTWLIDATLEPDTPLYFGIYEAQEKILLEAYRIATESAEAITPCLQQTAARFGAPRRVLHDLSDAMAAACTQVWPQVTHSVCHFHLLRDIGEDLYATPQAQLRDRLQHLKLQARLKEQRQTQTDWLREHPQSSTVLADVLAGRPVELSSATAGRELLLAVQQWLLDYPRDGARQGFPFDPYLLYFHRRVIRASAAVERLLQDSQVAGLAPLALKNFSRLLREYLGDPAIQAAAGQYEAAWTLFQRLRTLLRLEAQGAAPLHERYLLDELQAAEVQQSLAEFRTECQPRSVAEAEEASRERYQIVWEHLERYWGQLFAAADDSCRERTTNGLEGWWGSSKRGCRRRHGRKKLTREFRSLPAEFMLVGNLENPEYVDLVLDGELSNLAARLAEAGRTAGAWTAWRAAQQPLNRGRLPQRLIRRDDFLDEVTACYDEHCRKEAA